MTFMKESLGRSGESTSRASRDSGKAPVSTVIYVDGGRVVGSAYRVPKHHYKVSHSHAHVYPQTYQFTDAPIFRDPTYLRDPPN